MKDKCKLTESYCVYLYSSIQGYPDDRVSILLHVNSSLSKKELQTYYELLSSTISEVNIFTFSEWTSLGNKIDEEIIHLTVYEGEYEEKINNLKKSLIKCEKEFEKLSLKLFNSNFKTKAPPEVVTKCHNDYIHTEQNIKLLKNKLSKIDSLNN